MARTSRRHRSKLHLVAILALLVGCAPTRRPPETVGPLHIAPAAVDAVVKRLMGAAHVPGFALAVIEDGRPSYLAAYGVRDESGSPLTVDTVMSGASLTK